MSKCAAPSYLAGGVSCRERAEALRAVIGDEQVVYACRTPDGSIKIGYTRNLRVRRRLIDRDAQILGFTPGGFAEEQVIHKQLGDHDHPRGREFYYPTREVLEVVNAMRDRFNLPHLAA